MTTPIYIKARSESFVPLVKEHVISYSSKHRIKTKLMNFLDVQHPHAAKKDYS